MRKKLLSMLLVTVLSAGVLAGCGNNATKQEESKSKDSVKTSASSKVEETSKEDVKEDPVTVTWLIPESEPADLELVMEDLNKKLVEEINVELKLVCIEMGEYDDRAKLASTSGEEYDIVFTCSWLNKFSENLSRGAFLEITDLLEEYGQDIKAGLQENLWDVAKSGDGIYAIPNQQITAKQVGVAIQKEYADKYGWTKTHIEDGTELEWFFDKILENEKDVTPYMMAQVPFTNDLSEQIASYCYVYRDDDPSDGLTVVWDAEDTKAQNINNWWKKGYLHPEYATGGDLNAVRAANKFVAYGIIYSPYCEVSVSNSQGKEYIAVSVGDPYFSATAGVETMNAINVNSKNPEAAVKLLNLFWAKPELFNELLFGLEGVHYKKVGEERVEVIEGTEWNLWKNDWLYGNQFIRWHVPGEADDHWDLVKELNTSSKMSPFRGFVSDISEFQVELAQIAAVEGEYKNYWLRDNWEELAKERKEKLKAAGIETVVAEVQKQLDEWLAAK